MSVLIFGGTKGIGHIIAEHCASNCSGVTIVARNNVDLSVTQRNLTAKKNIVNISADITSELQVDKVFLHHEEAFGGPPKLVINAAAIQGPIGYSWTLPLSEWSETIKVDLTGSFIVSQQAIRHFMKRKSGTIILFSGGGAAYARPNFTAYSVAKTAVLRMVETIAEELKDAQLSDIHICAIAPGAVKTAMTYEIMQAKDKAGSKALEEAEQVMKNGGTASEDINRLIDFLSNPHNSATVSGRLVHVRENYSQFVAERSTLNYPDAGKLRRIPLIV